MERRVDQVHGCGSGKQAPAIRGDLFDHDPWASISGMAQREGGCDDLEEPRGKSRFLGSVPGVLVISSTQPDSPGNTQPADLNSYGLMCASASASRCCRRGSVWCARGTRTGVAARGLLGELSGVFSESPCGRDNTLGPAFPGRGADAVTYSLDLVADAWTNAHVRATSHLTPRGVPVTIRKKSAAGSTGAGEGGWKQRWSHWTDLIRRP